MFRSLRVSLLQLSCVLTRYLTELSVAKFLYSKRHLIPRIMAKTAWDVCAVKEASLLVQATPGMQTIDAVKLLAQHHINAVPVVSEDGVLQDTFCQSDLRVMAKPAGSVPVPFLDMEQHQLLSSISDHLLATVVDSASQGCSRPCKTFCLS
mmetsp:Transcript_13884/g.26883  ORF Transcript_13884/g.26883 Transcript_13884/m.26883 type:complete len:151 (+) Transcript_13884:318-770(+)